MPLINDETAPEGYMQTEAVLNKPQYSDREVLSSSVELWSDLYGAFRAFDDPMPDATEQEKADTRNGAWMPLEYMKGTTHDTDDRRHLYAELDSPSQVAWLDKRLDNEDFQRAVYDSAPWYQTLLPDTIALVSSPATLLTGGSGAAVSRGAKAVEFGIKAMAAEGMTQVALHTQQFTKDPVESAVMTVGAGAFGAGIGALVGGAGKNVIRQEADFVGPMPDFVGPPPAQPFVGPMNDLMGPLPDSLPGGSGGAMHVSNAEPARINAIYNDSNLTPNQKKLALFDLEAENHSPVNAALVLGTGRTLGAIHRAIPEIRIMLNKNPVMRVFGDMLLNHPLVVKGNPKGKGGLPLEEVTRLSQKKIDLVIPKIVRDGYSDYSKSFTGTKMTANDFEHAVQRVITSGARHTDEAVNTAAQRVKGEFLDDLHARLLKNGMLEDVKPLGDEGSWWTRDYSRGYALSVSKENYAAQLMPGVIKRLEARVAAGGEDGAKAAKRLKPKGLMDERKRLMGMRDALAHGSKDYGSDYASMGVLKDSNGLLTPHKGRTLDIATADIPQEMLRQDTVKALTERLKAYDRQLAAYEDPRFGDPTFMNFKDARTAHYEAELVELKSKGASDRTIKKAFKQLEKDIAEIDALAHRYNGVKSSTVSAGTQNVVTAFLAANSVTKLGRALLSQIPETVSTIGSVGGIEVVKHVVSTVTNPKLMRQLSRQVKRDMAAGNEVASVHRFAEKGMLDENSPAFARAMDKGADFVVDKLFMIGYWTRFIRTQAAVMVQSRVGRLMLKDKLSKNNITQLARMGITEDLIPAVRAEVQANHHVMSGGTIDAGIGRWANKDIQNIVETAIAGDVKHYQLEPGIGSMPFLGDTAHGALMLQFKSFTLMSTSRHLMAGVQKLSMGDMKAATQMIMMTAAGSVGYALRAQSYNREADLSGERLFREGWARGGWFGMGGDYNSVMEEMSGGQLSIFNALGFEHKTSSAYFGSKTVYSTGVGPTPQLFKDIIDGSMGMYGMIMNGEASKGQIRAARRIVPGNNYIAINTPFFHPIDDLENALIDRYAGGSKGGFLK